MTDPIQRADRARRILDDELMVEAREHMREAITKALWRRHSMSEDDKRRLDAMTAHYETFFHWFERILADGRVEEAERSAKQKIADAYEALKRKF